MTGARRLYREGFYSCSLLHFKYKVLFKKVGGGLNTYQSESLFFCHVVDHLYIAAITKDQQNQRITVHVASQSQEQVLKIFSVLAAAPCVICVYCRLSFIV